MKLFLAVLVLLIGIIGERDMVTTTTYQIITPDGVTFNLTASGYIVSGLDNIGMPPVRAYSHQVPGQSGAVLDDLLDDVRVVTISHAAMSDDVDGVFAAMNDVMANYRYNRTLTLQPLRLRVTFNTKAADLYCYYGGMITSKVDNVHALFGFTLVAYDPYWYATTATTTVLDTRDTLAIAGIIGRVDGLWTALGNPVATVFTYIRCMAVDASGDLYVGGAFTDFDGIAAADNIAKYDVSAGTWSAVGATPLNGEVSAMTIAANGDIYIGGQFTDAGGVVTADYIAVLLSGGADWTSITAGGATDDRVYALCLTADGSLWVGGWFTTIGGQVSWGVAEYNIAAGTWADRRLAVVATDLVYAIAEGQDGTIYIGGNFLNAGGDPDADNIAYWTGTTWAAVGGPMSSTCYALVVAPDGKLYAGQGGITWNGVTVNRIGVWNGSVVSALGEGVDNTVWALYLDNDNNLYASGAFTTAGGVATLSKVAIWNGNSWSPLPVALPGGSNCYAINGFDDNLFLGIDTTGDAYVPGDANVTHAGNVQSFPIIEVTGPGTLRSIRNETTGVEILADLVVNTGETITLDLGGPGEIPGGKSVTSSWTGRPNAGNLLGKIQSPTALARFALAPAPIAAAGVNLVNVYVTGGTATGSCKHYNRYDSLQAALD